VGNRCFAAAILVSRLRVRRTGSSSSGRRGARVTGAPGPAIAVAQLRVEVSLADTIRAAASKSWPGCCHERPMCLAPVLLIGDHHQGSWRFGSRSYPRRSAGRRWRPTSAGEGRTPPWSTRPVPGTATRLLPGLSLGPRLLDAARRFGEVIWSGAVRHGGGGGTHSLTAPPWRRLIREERNDGAPPSPRPSQPRTPTSAVTGEHRRRRRGIRPWVAATATACHTAWRAVSSLMRRRRHRADLEQRTSSLPIGVTVSAR
jgi:hypothetical protein